MTGGDLKEIKQETRATKFPQPISDWIKTFSDKIGHSDCVILRE
jgi:hypothetical protein